MKEELIMKKGSYDKLLRQVSKEQEKRVVIGFNQNAYGDTIITTGVPTELNTDSVTYVKKKNLSYDDYLKGKE